jgi:hypothetical protein
MRGKIMLFAMSLALAASMSQNLFASSSTVGLCAGPGMHYTTIGAAVAAAQPGTTIDVCPGNYPEQVMISKSLKLIGIQSGKSDAAVVTSPAGGVVANGTEIDGFPVAAQIFVQNAIGVTISHLTVDGSNNGLSGCGTDLVGIYYQNSSGTITDNAVRNQVLDPADFGCQDGLAVNIESTTGNPAVTVSDNSVRNYDKNGITADGLGGGSPGPNVTISGNTVIGVGATAGIAQNGIQVGFGATATITGNYVADDIYTGPSAGSCGILIYASTDVKVSGNTVESTQLAIATASDPTYGPADGASITSNHIGGTQNYDAIDLCSNGNIAKSNIIYGSAESGVHADDECPSGTGNNNTITNNTINEACAGILLGGTGNTFTPNTLLNVINRTLTGDSCTPPTMASLKAGPAGKPQSLRPSPFKPTRK